MMTKPVKYLSDNEINEFIRFFDRGIEDGPIARYDVEQYYQQMQNDIAKYSNIIAHNEYNNDDYSGKLIRNQILDGIFGPNEPCISRKRLFDRLHSYCIPSHDQVKKQQEPQHIYFSRRSTWRMIRAYWAVHGHEVIFVGIVFTLLTVFATLEVIKFRATQYTSAFGYGVVVAKACTGALYPIFFLITLSMSRYFSTIMRLSYRISRFVNLDLAKKCHIHMSCLGLLLVVVHAVSHLSGTFVQGSNASNTEAVIGVLSDKLPGQRYSDYICSRPGYTGVSALVILGILSLLSIPYIRRRHYNLFQAGHLLLYPVLGLMMVHGTAALLQRSIFGYVLAFPTFLLIFERISRFCLSFYHIDATVEVLTNDTIELTAVMPKYRPWSYTAGQYILLQVPSISFFQWHPFTVSVCDGKKIKLIIKTDGDWTSKLRLLGPSITVAINGPFGAPAQRFFDFEYSIIIGAGIGITPFSAILVDLQRKFFADDGKQQRVHTQVQDDTDRTAVHTLAAPPLQQNPHSILKKHRRTDFHWIVRNGRYLTWLTDLLNEVSASKQNQHDHDNYGQQQRAASRLDIRISTHVTAKHKNIVCYIFSWLLETRRSHDHPASQLTGLLNTTYFGRPDFDYILDQHYDDMKELNMQYGTLSPGGNNSGKSSSNDKCTGSSVPSSRKVGVFYCGAPEVGALLADKCSQLNRRGQEDGSRLSYYFMVEVF